MLSEYGVHRRHRLQSTVHTEMGLSGRVVWYVRRLRSMAPAEVVHHVRRTSGYGYDALVWNAARPLWRRSWEPAAGRVLSGPRPTGGLFLTAARLDEVRGALASAEAAILSRAELLLEGRVSVLGYPELRLGQNRAFDRDPFSGASWPDRHGRLIDYRRRGPGDPKVVWELERCQELPLLVLASLLSGEMRFAQAAASRLSAWVAAHPPGRGIAWANAFEPAVRAISLAVTYDALRGGGLLARESEQAVARSLWQHGRWISRDLSRFSSANNHLIGELVGLLAIATLAPELKDARRWRAQAINALSREADLQVLPDGFGVEQSFAYALSTVDLLLLTAALLESAGESCPEPIVSALRRSADALALLQDVDDPEPAFGDDDDARVLVLDGDARRTAGGVAASLAAYLAHGGAKRVAGALDPTAALLFGRRGVALFESAEPAEPPADGVLRGGGLVVLRRAGTRVLFDVGPLGYLSIAAHGHADALQVIVSNGPDELVSDPGTGTYLGDPSLRRHLRGTAAHATVCVDDADQSDQGGPFMWIRHAQARLLVCNLTDGIAVGEHDGYAALRDPVAHRRAVVALESGAVLVVDRLAGERAHTYVQTWPLHPALDPVESDTGIVVTRSESGTRSVVVVLDSTLPSSVVLARDGRWSRRLGQSEPAWVASQRVTASGGVELGALLVPFVGPEAPTPRLELRREGDACLATAVLGRDRYDISFDLASEAPVVLRRA